MESASEGLVFFVNNEWSGVPHILTRQSGTIPSFEVLAIA
jgi:hypothetical protein